MPPATEQHFDQGQAAPGQGLNVYVDVQSFDPMRNALEVTFEFWTASASSGGQDLGAGPVLVRVLNAGAERDFVLRRQDMAQPQSGFVNISRGTINPYPFDRYSADLRIEAHDGGNPAPGAPLPLRVTVWDRLAAWDIAVARNEQAANAAAIELRFAISRPYQIGSSR